MKERDMTTLDLAAIEAARDRIRSLVVRTPLVRLGVDDAPAEIYLKLENLQPTGSFKVRGAGNSVALLGEKERARGVFTCSAGNMAQALAWHARRLGIPCTVIVPDTAPKARRSRPRVYAVEPETAAPLAASFSKGAPAEVRRVPSFVDGIGTSTVLPEMWSLVRPLLEGALVVSLQDVAAAIRSLVERNRVVAEGAGGASVAAARAGPAGNGRVVCVVSGGNIDTAVLGKILRDEVP